MMDGEQGNLHRPFDQSLHGGCNQRKRHLSVLGMMDEIQGA
jgi:hypothetical protein